ncbi:hypothetical protein B6J49_26880 [Klebsiella pneumoniae]|jgi:hypothetical protein|uniref:hypothetical protein n=1 Tax=Klebsiella pneumoniae TaxID=573 RepID=UPI000C796FB6|nr:hypothetical protein [Klebsiella pneumoniae]EAP8847697.1 hypothetical protein [Salmonella enterica]EJE7200569.1 hypothetical protein [Escherichia coli]HDS7618346.1 hypothetical protein [Klebsiella pneumoniae subsp. ozaenae]PLI57232.1 hypothetical protein B6J49_26880 [Klebsiella pneumoniae]HDS3430093.1 hypothetical protein [Escherichia coli]
MQKSKRKLGFLRDKGSIPDQKQLEDMDQEVSSKFFRDLMESAQEAVEIHNGKRHAARRTIFHVNQVTKSVIERSEARTDVFTATDAPDLFKKLKMDRDN